MLSDPSTDSEGVAASTKGLGVDSDGMIDKENECNIEISDDMDRLSTGRSRPALGCFYWPGASIGPVHKGRSG